MSGAVDGDDLVPVSVVAGVSPFYGLGRTMVLSEHTAVRITDVENTCIERDGWSRQLFFDLFQDATQARSTVTAPTTLQVWLPDLNGGPIPTDGRAVVTFVRVLLAWQLGASSIGPRRVRRLELVRSGERVGLSRRGYFVVASKQDRRPLSPTLVPPREGR